MTNPWVRHWPVVGTSGKEHKVSQRADGTFGCSCMAWINAKGSPKKDCQHILQKKFELLEQQSNTIEIPKSKPVELETNSPIRKIRYK